MSVLTSSTPHPKLEVDEHCVLRPTKFTQWAWSHPALGFQRNFLSSLHEGLTPHISRKMGSSTFVRTSRQGGACPWSKTSMLVKSPHSPIASHLRGSTGQKCLCQRCDPYLGTPHCFAYNYLGYENVMGIRTDRAARPVDERVTQKMPGSKVLRPLPWHDFHPLTCLEPPPILLGRG